MSLLDCICCRKHGWRTATVWDNLENPSPCFLTYSELMSQVSNVAEVLSNYLSLVSIPFAPVAVFGKSSPDILVAILGVLSSPLHFRYERAERGVVGGVAYLPVGMTSYAEQWSKLQENEVELVLVEESALQLFITNYSQWASCELVVVDTTLLTLGLILVQISWKEQRGTQKVTSGIMSPSALVDYTNDCRFICHTCSSTGRVSGFSSWFDETVGVTMRDSLGPTDDRSKGAEDIQHITKNRFLSERDSYDLSNVAERSCLSSSLCPKTSGICNALGKGDATMETHKASDSHFEAPVSSGRVLPEAIAYVLSTSGTTGRPVSVRVPHCSIVPNILDLRSRFRLTPDDVIFNASPLTFDPSVVELFLALSCGGCLLMVPETIKRSPSDLAKVLFQRQYASVLQITPSLLSRFPVDVVRDQLLGDVSHVRVLALGGEQCPSQDQLIKWRHPENKTEVYNLYGITEVSSWATCHKLNLTTSSSSSSSSDLHVVPLGEPLLGTILELRNPETQSRVTLGDGVIWVGSRYRTCLVGGETAPHADGMRCTGDCGSVGRGGQVVCTGRMDRQIKRCGHRINLDHVQQRISSVLQLPCYVLDTSSNCAALKTGTCSDAATEASFDGDDAHESRSHGDAALVGFITINQGVEERTARLEEQSTCSNHILHKLRGVIPSSWIPDRLVIVKDIPVTTHGKVDMDVLLGWLSESNERVSSVSASSQQDLTSSLSVIPTKEQMMSFLISIIKSLTGHSLLTSMTRLTSIGIDSFDIVRLSNRISADIRGLGHLTSSFDALLEKLLDETLEEVAKYLQCEIHASASLIPSSRKRLSTDLTSNEGSKKVESGGTVSMPSEDSHVIHYKEHVTNVCIESRRRGQYFINGRVESIEVHLPAAGKGVPSGSKPSVSFSVTWKLDTHKCIDASPLMVLKKLQPTPTTEESEGVTKRNFGGYDDIVVYVGSHSHLFMAVELSTGKEVWHVELPDRVESSACISSCGKFVAVGCYDGCLYVLDADSGKLHWTFAPTMSDGETRPIKSSPCVDGQTGWVWFGSHDEHLYAVDIIGQRRVHKLYPGGGSIFSTPYLDQRERIIYIATLRGGVFAFHMDSGATLWSSTLSKPVFSSLAVLPARDKLVFGSVDGSLYSICTQTGKPLSRVSTGKSIFSSCCITITGNSGGLSQPLIICGSHDRYLYCWNENLELEWKRFLGSELYAIPFCHHISLQDHIEGWCVTVATTQGKLCSVDVKTGEVLCQLQLPGQIFSSPVAKGNRVIVGCRDNYLYCVDVCTGADWRKAN